MSIPTVHTVYTEVITKHFPEVPWNIWMTERKEIVTHCECFIVRETDYGAMIQYVCESWCRQIGPEVWKNCREYKLLPEMCEKMNELLAVYKLVLL